ncbi:DeoR/GlpR family DNA-binding transcription regulator [Sporosarcina sp. FSL K6-1522]|uniref:DeoR/GlpR family DNA-binding transcription regulator n=1 Tax=Sporosarcina sp. FSL K6-1522 TaxID=2921554 RepID=UPI00315B242D
MFAPERRQIILDQLTEHKRVTIKELSRAIKVSEATLRTDLTKMEDDGLLKRTHGGAMLVEQSDNETSFSTREQKNKFEKSTIAKQAAKLLSNGQCIMLDASSTALELARVLKDMPIRLTVVTSGINTALELHNHPDITVILLGGIVKKGSYSVEGNLGASILSQIHIDIMFTSANGFTITSGLTDFSMYEVELKKSMVTASKKIVALLDHTKMNKNSFASFATTSQIDMIITDNSMPEGYKEQLIDLDVEVLIASPNKL